MDSDPRRAGEQCNRPEYSTRTLAGNACQRHQLPAPVLGKFAADGGVDLRDLWRWIWIGIAVQLIRSIDQSTSIGILEPMDPISLLFYAVVCGILSAVAPNLGGIVPRLLTGGLVGIVAAIVLPFLKGMMTGY